MKHRGLLIALPLVFAAPTRAAEPVLVVEHARGLTVTIDATQARPGGLLVVRLRSARALGAASALLDGRRTPFFATREGPRALVGIPVTATAGPAPLGIELRGRRGRRRLSVAFVVTERVFPSRATALADDRRALLSSRYAVRDSRRLLAALRTASETAHWNGRLRPPVDASPRATFGMTERTTGGASANQLLDGQYGEYHRGLDYEVPVGTLVQAPAAGIVILSAQLAVAGLTVVVDHGHGLVSVLCHLSRIDVAEGQWLEGRTVLGVSGESGAVSAPHVHWGTYLSGIAVDPSAIMASAF
jgi:murein DD-endopeptidase MepM/ murein hydrolase activator NlpD